MSFRRSLTFLSVASILLVLISVVDAKKKRPLIGGGGSGGAAPSLCPDPGVGFSNLINADGNFLTNAAGDCIAAKV